MKSSRPIFARVAWEPKNFLPDIPGTFLDALEGDDLGNAARIPGSESPADGLTKAAKRSWPVVPPVGNGRLPSGTVATAAWRVVP